MGTSLTARVHARVAARLAMLRRTRWPEDATGPGVAAVVVNYNTAALVAALVFSLSRVLPEGALRSIVVVDNGSVDESPEMLRALDAAGIVTYLRNPGVPHHGPGLNRGISHLALDARDRGIGTVWILDSDVIVLRPETLAAAEAARRATDATYLGQVQDHWSLPGGAVNIATALLRPADCWRAPFPTFRDDGEPWRALQRAIHDAGLGIEDFPFLRDDYVLHLGHGTLRQILESGDERNAYHEWARLHHDFTFEHNPRGPALLAAFREILREEVGALTPDRLVDACLRPERLPAITVEGRGAPLHEPGSGPQG